MSYEEMQKTMQFILEQQAQLVANGQRTDEIIVRISNTVDRLATATVERFERTDARISADSEDVNAKFAALIDAQMRTEEAVKNLTAVVDRYFRGRNGQAGQSETP